MMETLNDTPFAAGMLFTKLGSGEEQLTVIVKGTFDLAKGEAQIAEPQQPLSSDRFQDDDPGKALVYEDDFAPFKPRADLLLAGSFHPAAFQVGGQRASLADYGPRSRRTAQRAALAGPLGDDWFTCHWPLLSADCPWAYFNAAPAEMTALGYLRGDEPLSVEPGEPGGEELNAELPGLRVRSFLQHGNGEIAEVTMNLDTLWVDPAEARLVLVWRGRTAAEAGDLEDAGRLLIASEPLDQSQPAESYEARLSAAPEQAPEEPDPEAEMDAALAEMGLEPGAMPEEVGAFMRSPETGAEGFAGVTGVDGSGPAMAAQLEKIAAIAAGGGAIGAIVADSGAAVAAPEFAEQAGLGDSQTAAQADQSIPVEVKGFMDDPEAGSSDLVALLKTEEAPMAQKLAADAEKQTPPVISSAEEFDQAIASVPEWPPQSANEVRSMETLTRVFGAGRPPEGDGAGFLIVLNGFAGETSEAAPPPDVAEPYEDWAP